MVDREPALVTSQCESLHRISKDWVGVASSLDAKNVATSIRDLNHPPSVKKTMRTAGIALAVAPEPFTTVAGVALIAGSFAMREEPTTLKSVAEELSRQMSTISDLGLDELSLSV